MHNKNPVQQQKFHATKKSCATKSWCSMRNNTPIPSPGLMIPILAQVGREVHNDKAVAQCATKSWCSRRNNTPIPSAALMIPILAQVVREVRNDKVLLLNAQRSPGLLVLNAQRQNPGAQRATTKS
jgi:hypothetical protein